MAKLLVHLYHVLATQGNQETVNKDSEVNEVKKILVATFMAYSKVCHVQMYVVQIKKKQIAGAENG